MRFSEDHLYVHSCLQVEEAKIRKIPYTKEGMYLESHIFPPVIY